MVESESFLNLSTIKTIINQFRNIHQVYIFSDVVDKKYGTCFRNIDVMIEHTYYHHGQIILIKKRIKNRN